MIRRKEYILRKRLEYFNIYNLICYYHFQGAHIVVLLSSTILISVLIVCVVLLLAGRVQRHLVKRQRTIGGNMNNLRSSTPVLKNASIDSLNNDIISNTDQTILPEPSLFSTVGRKFRPPSRALCGVTLVEHTWPDMLERHYDYPVPKSSSTLERDQDFSLYA